MSTMSQQEKLDFMVAADWDGITRRIREALERAGRDIVIIPENPVGKMDEWLTYLSR